MSERWSGRVRLTAEQLPEAASWAAGMDVELPHTLVQQVREGGAPGEVSGLIDALRLRAVFTTQPPVSTRLPINYRSIPGPARRLMASGIGRLQRLRQSSWARFPGWPLDLSVDAASDIAGLPRISFTRTPVLLTHDIDSLEGLVNMHRLFLPVEEAVNARSANYVVPCAWPVDHQRLADAAARGHEIGVHGYDHSNQSPFLSHEARAPRLAAGHVFARQWGAVGYRAPSLLRTRALIDDLQPLYHYDSSIPTSGGPFPVPNNGCASARPWRFGKMWEIPLSLPRDGSLRFLGHSPKEILRLWKDTAERVRASGGVVCLLTHCEEGFSGNAAMLAAYQGFLEWVAADSRYEFLRPVDLVDRLNAAVPAA